MNNVESCPFLGSPEHTCDQLGPAHGHTCSRCLSPRPSRLFSCVASLRRHRVIDFHLRPRSCWLCWPIGAAPMCQPRPPPPPPRSHCVRENESRGLKEQGHHTRAPRSAPPAVRDELGVLPEVRGQLKEALLLTPQTVGMRALGAARRGEARWGCSEARRGEVRCGCSEARPCASTTGDRQAEHGVSSTRLGRHWRALVGPPCWRRVLTHSSTRPRPAVIGDAGPCPRLGK